MTTDDDNVSGPFLRGPDDLIRRLADRQEFARHESGGRTLMESAEQTLGILLGQRHQLAGRYAAVCRYNALDRINSMDERQLRAERARQLSANFSGVCRDRASIYRDEDSSKAHAEVQ